MKDRDFLLQAIATNIPGVIYQFYASDAGDYGVSYVSERAEEIFGLSTDLDTFFPSFTAQVLQEDRNSFLNSIEEAVTASTIWKYEGRFVKPDGELMWFQGMATPQREKERLLFHGVLLDITERKHAEETLKESEAAYRMMFDQSPNIIALSRLTGEYVDVNKKFLEYTGLRLPEVLGRTPLELGVMDIDQYATLQREFKRCGDRGIDQFETIICSPASGYRFDALISSRVIPVRGEPQVLSIISDISELKLAEVALRQREGVMKSLLAATPAGVALLKDRTFIQVNTALCRITGYSKEEMEGMQTRILYPDEEEFLRVGKELYEQMEQEGLGVKEAILRRKDGALIVVILSLSPFDPADPSAGVCATVLDITERKRAEKALTLERRFFEALFEALPGHAYVLDENGCYIRCNRNLVQSYGKTLIGRNLFEDMSHIHPEHRERARRSLEQGLTDNQASVEYISLQEDGTEVPRFTTAQTFELDGKRYGVGVSFDISDRVKAEEELRRLSIAIEQVAEDIIITDPEGIIQYVNPAFEKITGYSQREAIGQTPSFLKSGVHGPEFYGHLWNTIKSGKIWSGRITNRRKDGKLILEDATISPLLTSVDKLTGYVALKRDVTEAVRLEAQLRQGQKMEAIGTLAGGIAHDFNNILGAMMGYAELIKFKTTDAKIHPYLEQILKACDRSRDLVKQILTFSRQREQEKKPVSVIPIVKEAMKLLRSSLPTTVEIRQYYRSAQDTVLADATQIHQVLMNLCTNAVHAMRQREGVLEVNISRQVLSTDNPAYDPELKEGAYLQLVVSDTGEGIDPAIKDKIFDPFFTTKKSGEGTGLGLSVVYGIVKDHGGIITVESEPGKGTVFTIFLPLILADEELAGPGMVSLPQGKGHILYVDDEEAIASLGREMLSSLGYDVTIHLRSRDALEAFRAHPERFDLVITDMTMPHMMGTNMAREMLKIRPGLPIILTTGFSEGINEEESKKIGIREFIMKPFTLHGLAQAVKRTMDQEVPPAGC